jgi:energy-coupling factor transporter ATP-binding protein EcfA2
MKITSVIISNFKAINEATLELHPTMNVLVGANGSGKSSVLQALHWMFQSGRNANVQPRAVGLASTLSELDAIYMPSPDYRSAGHGNDYGNTQGKPQLDLKVDAVADDGTGLQALMWLKSARNEGISVHVPTGNQVVAAIRDRSREFSAYIPGLAGIPLVEEKRSKLLVHRSAAAGDANTVLRNILVLLKQVEVNGENGLAMVETLVSRVMGEFALKVDFDEERHTRIAASFQTGGMRKSDERSFRPLELAGIGYLQVLQIFSYLVYFRPVVLLVDEPDAHLYPVAQERLVRVLSEAAATFDSQVLLTTHSPSIVRSLPSESKVIWMKEGAAQPTGNREGRQLMGWGLLDRKIVLMTEDTNTEMLRQIIAQWPDLERAVAIWPFHGSGKLPPPETLDGLKALLGDDVKILVHRDRDFMMPVEVATVSAPYIDHGHLMWVTKYSDVEASWMDQEIVAKHFGISLVDAEALLNLATAEANISDTALIKRRNKRSDALFRINNRGTLPQFGDDDVFNEYARDGEQFAVLGKAMMSAVRKVSQDQGRAESPKFGKQIPQSLSAPLASDLKALIESSLT